MSEYTLLIENLTLEVIIGVLERERKEKQKVIIEAKIIYDKDEHFLDYVQVVEAISNMMEYKMYDTLENAIEGITKALKIDFPEIKSIYLKIYKPEVFKNALVGVEKEISYL